MNREIIYISLIAILIIVLIVFVILTQEERKDLVELSQCFKPKGEYAVDPGFTSADVLNLCGSDGKSVCTFTVSNLANATDICNTNPEKCSRFIYNEQTNIMSFISDQPSFIKNPNINIYIRQGGTTTTS